jgi:hypothetical protein
MVGGWGKGEERWEVIYWVQNPELWERYARRSTLLLSLPAPIALSGNPKRPSLAKVVQYSLATFKWREWLNDWRCLEGSDTMKRKPKKVLGKGEGVCMTVIPRSKHSCARLGYVAELIGVSQQTHWLYVVKKVEYIFYPMFRDFQDIALPVCPSGKNNV